jgi:hypothetical protein
MSFSHQRARNVAAHAATAFGERLFQLAADRMRKIDPRAGRAIGAIPAAGGGEALATARL